jgi:hypothetical protein
MRFWTRGVQQHHKHFLWWKEEYSCWQHFTKIMLKYRISFFPCFFPVSSCFFVLLGEEGLKTPQKNTQKHKKRKGMVDFFHQNIDPKTMSAFPSIFYRVFLCFSVRGIRKKHQNKISKTKSILVLFRPPSNQPTTSRSVFFRVPCGVFSCVPLQWYSKGRWRGKNDAGTHIFVEICLQFMIFFFCVFLCAISMQRNA